MTWYEQRGEEYRKMKEAGAAPVVLRCAPDLAVTSPPSDSPLLAFLPRQPRLVIDRTLPAGEWMWEFAV